jgi:hypothetical protein
MDATHYMEVRYEQLIAEPCHLLEQLCEFLGEPFSPQILNFHEPKANSWKANLQPLQNEPVNTNRPLSLWQRLEFRWLASGLIS